jgi:LCP family protein required for cell wall assembly
MTAAQRPSPRGRTWPQRLIVIVGCVVVMACLGAASVAGYIGLRFGQIDRIEDIDLQAREAGEPANYLVVGTDSREGIDASDPDAGVLLGASGCDCTDTIMVVRVDPDEKEAYLLSFPRDLYLPISGTGESARINSAHAHGVQTLIDTIQDNFEIPIHHYVEIDFVGFEKLVDAVGGVPMWFDAPLRDLGSALDVPNDGCQVLDGQQARRFVRSRHLEFQDVDGVWRTADGTADLGRITRQQVFVRRAISKAVSKGLSNPVVLNELVSAGVANVSLDEHLNAGDLLAMGRAFASFDADQLIGYSIPSEPRETSSGDYGGELALMGKAQTALNVFRGLPPGTLSPESIDVTVLNGTGVDGQAGDAAGALRQVGFNVGEVASNDTEGIARTTILFGNFGETAARRLASHITGGAHLVYDPTIGNGEDLQITLITGLDFTTVHGQPAPEGSPDDRATTVSKPEDSTSTTQPGETTTSTTVPTTTTTVIGYSTGEPPEGVDCG